MLAATIVTAIIAFLALILSAYTWWYNFVHNKAAINLIFKTCKYINNVSGKPLSFNLILENCSHLDVAISRMFLNIDNHSYEFDNLPNFVLVYTSPTEKHTTYSKELPLKISGLGAEGGYFNLNTTEYPNLCIKKLLENDVSITVYTNRKLIKTFKININASNTYL